MALLVPKAESVSPSTAEQARRRPGYRVSRSPPVAVAALLVMTAVACAPSSSGVEQPSPAAVGPFGGTDSQATRRGTGAPRMIVRNEHTSDLKVYLVRGSTPARLGTVGSFRERTFQLSRSIARPSADPAVHLVTIAGREEFTSR